MKNKILCLLVFLFHGLAAAAPQEKIVRFESEIRIERNGALTVTEKLRVLALGQQIKRGLLRDFPTEYIDKYGQTVRVPFEVLSVTRDGATEKWRTEKLQNGVRIRIGQAEVMLPRGEHDYVITYRTARQIGFFAEHDELYWNVTGNGWTLPIETVQADIFLPAAVPAHQMSAELYTGAFGAKERDGGSEFYANGARFFSTRAFSPGEGLTVVLGFPKGLVEAPGRLAKLRAWLQDNLGLCTGAAGVLLVWLGLFLRWNSVGRDPKKGPLFPRYEAPEGLGPAALRYLHKMTYDDRCFGAALLGLGQRGALHLSEASGDFHLQATGKTPQPYYPGEKALLTDFLGGGSITLTRDYNPLVKQAREALAQALKNYCGTRFFARHRGTTVFFGLVSFAVLVAMMWLETPPLAIGIVFVLLLAGVLISRYVMPAYTPEGRRLKDEIEGLKQYLSVAEGDDLARLKKPPATPEEFARFLPYAFALNVEKNWADRFVALLGAAAVAQATAYYLNDHFNSEQGISSMTNAFDGLSDTVSAASTAPGSSSGSSSDSGSGGGSSGGGGGGGGGSGW